jgi:hypothetical protein
MADYRQIHTKIWSDEWFLELEPDAKLLFIYLFSNSRSCLAGIYDIPLKLIAFETGLDPDRILALLAQFAADGKVFSEDGHIWIPKLLQYNASNIASIKIQSHIVTLIEALPDIPLRRRWIDHYNDILAPRYDIPTLAIGIPHEHEQEQEREQSRSPQEAAHLPALSRPQTVGASSAPGECPHPSNLDALRAYYQETGHTLSPEWQARVQAQVGTSEEDLALWQQTIIAWLGQGWNPGNVQGMLERYEKRSVPGTDDVDGSSPTGPPYDPGSAPLIISGLNATPEWLGASDA